jgi:uncharacterized repeat protein (TIGR01451 family)
MPRRLTALIRPRLLTVGLLLVAGQAFLVPPAAGDDDDIVVTPTVSPEPTPDGTLPEGEVADLVTTKRDDPPRVTEENQVAYTVTVLNIGPDTATEITLTDRPPEGSVFVSVESDDGFTCAEPTEEGVAPIECSLEALPADESASVQLIVTAPEVGNEDVVISETAEVDAAQVDPEPENNLAIEQTTVLPRDAQFSSGFIAPEGARLTTDVGAPGPSVDDPTVIGMRFPQGPGGDARIREVKCAPPFAPCIDIVGKLVPPRRYERIFALIRHDPSVVNPDVPDQERKVFFKKPGRRIRELDSCGDTPNPPCVLSVDRNADNVLVFKVLLSSDPRLGTR